MTTVLYPEALYSDDALERDVFGPGVRVLMRDVGVIAELNEADCAAAEGLMIMRQWVTAQDLARFPRLRAVVRMGVGYDRIDRAAAAARGILVCNVPDYGTAEVADHALALMLGLRRGLFLHHDAQRAASPASWKVIETPLVRRIETLGLGIVGLGRIGTAVALRARAFGFRVTFYDPYRPDGTERALGIARARTLEELLPGADVLSLHAPLTPETRGMLGLDELRLLPEGAVVINTARGPLMDLAALEVLLREGRIAGAGLDVLPEEPPGDPLPDLLRAYRAREAWLAGRLVVTPHSAFHSPEAWEDIRRKSAETMAAALLTDQPRNVIPPESW
ncbi:C-terminal binding protein [Rhodovastum atsumiense]|uniref:C-terminal binding protein n=1 Tax=Rhodovastum atsumiense TaxID=504468 RepID=A0A5M6IP39_9PROT|nr:C-terminal binding protein [Rhodovastum atsumiense]KAA5609737.1 C-terminal binding protein [Rhodovastum atsumiense]CAH2604509.1 C-terminal binding protein [Rhodovastum atsumiense]